VEEWAVKGKQALEVVYGNCAGVDVGGAFHMVAIDPGQAEAAGQEPVKRFEAYTEDLEAMAWWLRVGSDGGVLDCAAGDAGAARI
jgi:hypothetical protein